MALVHAVCQLFKDFLDLQTLTLREKASSLLKISSSGFCRLGIGQETDGFAEESARGSEDNAEQLLEGDLRTNASQTGRDLIALAQLTQVHGDETIIRIMEFSLFE